MSINDTYEKYMSTNRYTGLVKIYKLITFQKQKCRVNRSTAYYFIYNITSLVNYLYLLLKNTKIYFAIYYNNLIIDINSNYT